MHESESVRYAMGHDNQEKGRKKQGVNARSFENWSDRDVNGADVLKCDSE